MQYSLWRRDTGGPTRIRIRSSKFFQNSVVVFHRCTSVHHTNKKKVITSRNEYEINGGGICGMVIFCALCCMSCIVERKEKVLGGFALFCNEKHIAQNGCDNLDELIHTFNSPTELGVKAKIL